MLDPSGGSISRNKHRSSSGVAAFSRNAAIGREGHRFAFRLYAIWLSERQLAERDRRLLHVRGFAPIVLASFNDRPPGVGMKRRQEFLDLGMGVAGVGDID